MEDEKTEHKCMDCGKPTILRKAPSMSMLPRCEECNAKRWQKAFDDEKRLGVRTVYYDDEVNPLDDPWG